MDQLLDVVIFLATLPTIMIEVPNFFNEKNQPECSFDLYGFPTTIQTFALNLKSIKTKDDAPKDLNLFNQENQKELSFDLYKFPNKNDPIFEVQEDSNQEAIYNLYLQDQSNDY